MRFGVLAGVLLVLAGCADRGAPPSGDVRLSVGPAGGELSLPGARLEIPPGALRAELALTARELGNEAIGVLRRIDFGPDGTRFSVPATLVIELDEWDPAYSLAVREDGRWKPLENVTFDAKTGELRGHVHHFSEYGVVRFEAPVSGYGSELIAGEFSLLASQPVGATLIPVLDTAIVQIESGPSVNSYELRGLNTHRADYFVYVDTFTSKPQLVALDGTGALKFQVDQPPPYSLMVQPSRGTRIVSNAVDCLSAGGVPSMDPNLICDFGAQTIVDSLEVPPTAVADLEIRCSLGGGFRQQLSDFGTGIGVRLLGTRARIRGCTIENFAIGIYSGSSFPGIPDPVPDEVTIENVTTGVGTQISIYAAQTRATIRGNTLVGGTIFGRFPRIDGFLVEDNHITAEEISFPFGVTPPPTVPTTAIFPGVRIAGAVTNSVFRQNHITGGIFFDSNAEDLTTGQLSDISLDGNTITSAPRLTDDVAGPQIVLRASGEVLDHSNVELRGNRLEAIPIPGNTGSSFEGGILIGPCVSCMVISNQLLLEPASGAQPFPGVPFRASLLDSRVQFLNIQRSPELAVGTLGADLFVSGTLITGNEFSGGTRVTSFNSTQADNPNSFTSNTISDAEVGLHVRGVVAMEVSLNQVSSLQEGLRIEEVASGRPLLTVSQNDFLGQGSPRVVSNFPIELSAGGVGNHWGKSCCSPLATVPFIAGEDSNSPTVTDSFAWGVSVTQDTSRTLDEFLAAGPPGCQILDTDMDGLTAVTGDCDDCLADCGDVCADGDGDGAPACGDCDDGDPTIFPGAQEVCDGIDNNCNSEVDEDTSPDCTVDADGDGVTVAQGDCDDLDPTVNPNAPELCDQQDNNCDTVIDDGACGIPVFVPGEPIQPYRLVFPTQVDRLGTAISVFVPASAQEPRIYVTAANGVELGHAALFIDGVQAISTAIISPNSQTMIVPISRGIHQLQVLDPTLGQFAGREPPFIELVDERGVCGGAIADFPRPLTPIGCDILPCPFPLEDGPQLPEFLPDGGRGAAIVRETSLPIEFNNPFAELRITVQKDVTRPFSHLDARLVGSNLPEPQRIVGPQQTLGLQQGFLAPIDAGQATGLNVALRGAPDGAFRVSLADLDATPPVVQITNAVQGTLTNEPFLNIRGLINDESARVFINDVEVPTVPGNSATFDACLGFTELVQQWNIVAVDQCGNTSFNRFAAGRECDGRLEMCNGFDDDCDGEIDEEAVFDKDDDGFTLCGVQGLAVACGLEEVLADCDDTDSGKSPGATELCDGIDNDCDGLIDEGFPLQDADGDGLGVGCGGGVPSDPGGELTAAQVDCDDSDATTFPGAPELCERPFGLPHDCLAPVGSNTDFCIARSFAPLVHLHPREEHFPASIPWLLERTELVFQDGNEQVVILPNAEISLDAQTLVSRFVSGQPSGSPFDFEETDFFISMKGDSRLGQIPTNDGQVPVPCYVRLLTPPASPTLDIQYWFFSPFNGLERFGIGRHEGDWEHATVRLSRGGTRVLGVMTARHGHTVWVDRPDLTFTEDSESSSEHPRLWSALESHATYHKAGKFRSLIPFLREPFDLASDGGATWECPNTLELLGELNAPEPGKEWLQFTGTWGDPNFERGGIKGPARKKEWPGEEGGPRFTDKVAGAVIELPEGTNPFYQLTDWDGDAFPDLVIFTQQLREPPVPLPPYVTLLVTVFDGSDDYASILATREIPLPDPQWAHLVLVEELGNRLTPGHLLIVVQQNGTMSGSMESEVWDLTPPVADQLFARQPLPIDASASLWDFHAEGIVQESVPDLRLFAFKADATNAEHVELLILESETSGFPPNFSLAERHDLPILAVDAQDSGNGFEIVPVCNLFGTSFEANHFLRQPQTSEFAIANVPGPQFDQKRTYPTLAGPFAADTQLSGTFLRCDWFLLSAHTLGGTLAFIDVYR